MVWAWLLTAARTSGGGGGKGGNDNASKASWSCDGGKGGNGIASEASGSGGSGGSGNGIVSEACGSGDGGGGGDDIVSEKSVACELVKGLSSASERWFWQADVFVSVDKQTDTDIPRWRQFLGKICEEDRHSRYFHFTHYD